MQTILHFSTLLITLLLSITTNPHGHVSVNFKHGLSGNESDHEALLAIKAEISSDPHSVLSSWNNSRHFCNWKGVTCGRRHQRVVSLLLLAHNLVGTLSPFIGNLTFLSQLDLSNNSFRGEIPRQISYLHRLQFLSLDTNYFEGEIPANLSRCLKLNYLFLGYNNLIGKIPTQLVTLPNWRMFVVIRNRLSGRLEDIGIGNMSTSIQALFLNDNRLEGSIPDDFARLKGLSKVSLSGNLLTGNIPSSIFNLSNLKVLDLSRNKVYGRLPLDLDLRLPSLSTLYVSECSLTGQVPISISNLSNLVNLDISFNSFRGKFSINGNNLPYLSQLHMQYAFSLEKEGKDLNFLDTLTNCTELTELILEGNSFTGSFPLSILNLSISIEELDLGSNKISGQIPLGLGKFVNLYVLWLNENYFTDHIPIDIGKMESMQALNLPNNNFSGELPSSLGNLTSLSYLDLRYNSFQGSFPESLGNCTNLVKLWAYSNNLSGSFPNVLFRASSLISLTLGQNNFEGLLPMEISTLKNLDQLDVSQNRFLGEIPSSLGEYCTSLTFLDMSYNSFVGSIPKSFSSLKNIQQLDLSSNHFSGQIPDYFSTWPSLLALNLSFNDLSGDVPTHGIFANTSAISIVGNDKFCGGVPQLHLPRCPEPKPRRSSSRTIMIISISCVLIVALSVSICLYFLCSSRKRKDPPSGSPSIRSFLEVSYQMLHTATEGFSKSNLIGLGGFGSVYKGTLQQDDTELVVAVKVMNLGNEGATKSFMAECKALRNIRHRNLVKVITACSSIDAQRNDFKALVYEFMPRGSLEDWLHSPISVTNTSEHGGGSLSLLQRLKYGIGSKVSSEGDVYSLGIVILEMMTSKKPTDPMFNNGLNLHEHAKSTLPDRVMEIIDQKMLGDVNDLRAINGNDIRKMECIKSLIIIGVQCSMELPQERMNIKDVLNFATYKHGIRGNESDHEALLAIKAAISDDPHSTLSSWNNASQFCWWEGVTCGRRHQRVVVLDLSESNLVGTLSPFIGDIPHQISRLSKLNTINLMKNYFTGEIPANLSRCVRLKSVSLSYNYLRGKIPTQLLTLSSMTDFDVYQNHLSGRLQDIGIGNMSSSLESLFLSFNYLEGSIPDDIGRLESLTTLGLSGNSLTGIIPTSLFNLSNLNSLDLGNNRIHGPLPQDLGLLLPHLSHLYLDKCFLISRESFQSMGIIYHLVGLYVQNAFSLGRETRDLNFLDTLTNCSSLEHIYLSSNSFTGSLPPSVLNLSTSLKRLDLAGNQISGEIPLGLGKYVNLFVLWLDSNQFAGNIPLDIGELKSLQALVLSSNNLSGEIPSSLGNLTILNLLTMESNNLQGPLPESLGNCTKLQTLSLARNNFSGSFPSALFRASSLVSLRIGQNGFQGSFPIEIGSLKNLDKLDASKNWFSGEISSSLGECRSITFLDMSRNSFVGSIPKSFSSLRNIQYLDFSFNNFSGQIPDYFSNWPSLSNLNLSFNNLNGEVPKDGIFANTSVVSIAGNDKLCGGVPQLHLPKCLRQKKRKFSLVVVKIISITCALIVLSLVALCIYFFCSSRKGKDSPGPQNIKPFLEVSYQMLHTATNGFSLSNLLGSGGFGSVYKGILHQDDTELVVAVKVMNLQNQGAGKSFIAECKALRNIRHRNLVKVITACSSIDAQRRDFKALVYEFIPKGSLENWLHSPNHVAVTSTDHGGGSLSLLQRISIAIDVASALEYLHTGCGNPIIHCDLKPSNILLDDEMTARVGDFGLSKFVLGASTSSIADHTSSTQVRGTVGYVAPEYGIGSKVSPEGDMYSLGIVILELMTSKKPTYSMFNGDLNLHDFAKAALPDRMMEIIDDGMLGDDDVHRARNALDIKKRECINSVVTIGVQCSMELPHERMSVMNVSDYEPLLAIKAEISKDPYSVLISWNKSLHFCKWEGVACGRRHRRVVSLDLSSSNLVGTLSPFIGNMSFLQNLNLSENFFRGEVPHQISRLSRLRMLSLSQNSFQGEIPTNLSRCLHLKTIYLSHNELVGSVPSQLVTLPNLLQFVLSFNNLSGDLQAIRFGNISTSLQVLYLNHNQLQGSIPNDIGRLKSLTGLSLGDNLVSGTIPKSLFNLSRLNYIRLSNSNIQGHLPQDLGFLLPRLGNLMISNTDLIGQVPISLSNLSELVVLDISFNNFKGRFPINGNNSPLLSGIYTQFAFSPGGEPRDLSFLDTLANCTNLIKLLIGDNSFTGSFPRSILNLSTSLELFGLYSNQVSGQIPLGLGKFVNLYALDFHDNYLTGEIPSDIGQLQGLELFYLYNNNFSEEIPSSFGNITRLSVMSLDYNNLEGSIPRTLGNCVMMEQLSLSYNNLVGNLHADLFRASSIFSLDISQNKLEGSLPIEISNLKNLVELDVSQNRFLGEIPSTLGGCTSLTILNMSTNYFFGSIPDTLSPLKSIQELDLSHNNFSGQIPFYLSTWTYLSSLNLSFNSFNGEVPKKGVFGNASALSIVGNTKLCGGIPQLNLPRCAKPKRRRRSPSKMIMIISITSGCALVLVLSIAVCLCFLGSSRNKNDAPTESQSIRPFLEVSYQMLQRATDGFSSSNLIGVGGFGSVYKGILRQHDSELAVAVKVMNHQNYDRASKSFTTECKALRNIRHRNLVKIITACSSIDAERNDFKALVYEFMPMGSLEDWLHSSKFDLFTNECVEYGIGSKISLEGDMYSFGIIVLELMTSKRPTDPMFNDALNLHEYAKVNLPARVMEIVDQRMIEDANMFCGRTDVDIKKIECIKSLIMIGIKCSIELPQERMKIKDVVDELRSIRHDLLGRRT
ncbi:hypothetical protein V2J09_007206 [Rumex salicifolius]